MASTKPKRPDRPGVIVPAEIYTSDELKRRLGWGPRSLNRAKKDGLKVRRYGNVRFVRGSDFIDWIAKAAEIESPLV